MLSGKYEKCNTLFAVAVILFALLTGRAHAAPDIAFDFTLERIGIAEYRITVHSFDGYAATLITINGIEVPVPSAVDGFTADFRSESVLAGETAVNFSMCTADGDLQSCSLIAQWARVEGVTYVFLPVVGGN